MGINNRTLDPSEQKKDIQFTAGALATGVTGVAAYIPWTATVAAAQLAAFGLSGTPTVALYVNRFIPGTGFTAFTITGAQTAVAFGTSGVIAVTSQSGAITGGVSFSVGTSLLTLFPNDVVQYQTGGTNSAVTGLTGLLVLTPVQDVKQHLAGLA